MNTRLILKKIHPPWGQQGKHIVGYHNYEVHKNRSILEHADPQSLLEKYAGKGIKTGKAAPGTFDYKEVVNFEEFIGYDIDPNTNIKIPTTWGKIHYGKNGAHIVPTKPRQ